jgi:hypothetical protein
MSWERIAQRKAMSEARAALVTAMARVKQIAESEVTDETEMGPGVDDIFVLFVMKMRHAVQGRPDSTVREVLSDYSATWID